MAGVCVFHLLTQGLSATANLQEPRLLRFADQTAIEIITETAIASYAVGRMTTTMPINVTMEGGAHGEVLMTMSHGQSNCPALAA